MNAKHILAALALVAAPPLSAEVITWRVDGAARTAAGPLGHFADPVLTALPDEPAAWQSFSYDTATGFTSAAFDFGAFEGYAVGPITGPVLLQEFGVGPPIAGWARADWMTSYGLIQSRPFDVGSGFSSLIAGASTVIAYRFDATDSYLTRAAVFARPATNTVPEPAPIALVLLGLVFLMRRHTAQEAEHG